VFADAFPISKRIPIGNPPGVPRTFYGDPLPHMRWPWKPRSKRCQTLSSFSEDLEDVPVRLAHDIKRLTNELLWNRLVKKVAHAVDEDGPRLGPPKR